MYKLTKNVIEMGGFDLTEILRKIDALWLKGSITDNERSELYNMAQTKAKAKDSIDIIAKISELESKINTLEIKLEGGENGVPEEKPAEYEEYVVGKWYYTGNKVKFKGKNYECTAPEGVACVWSPDDYPAYWKGI